MAMAKTVESLRRRQSVPVWGFVTHRVPVWGFVIHRGDGEAVRLHPNQTAPTARVCMTHVHYPRQPRAVRQKGAAPKCSFRCRASQRMDLRWPCCASSRTVLSSLSVRVSSHDPRWVMGRCGRNGRCRKTRCFRRQVAASPEGLSEPRARTGPR